jgi:hypothetical protein
MTEKNLVISLDGAAQWLFPEADPEKCNQALLW